MTMSNSTGYFLNATSRLVLKVFDHSLDATNRPSDLGFLEDDFAGLNPLRDRVAIIQRILNQGWIRVRTRNHGSEASLEFAVEWIPAIEAAFDCATELGFGPTTYLTFRHIHTGESIGIHLNQLSEAFAEGSVEDLLNRIEMK